MAMALIGKETKRAVFLDRDGVINENRQDYVKNRNEFVFLPGVLESLVRLAQSEFLIIVISNQSAINRRLVLKSEVEEINRQMITQIENIGGRIDKIYYCPHRPDEACLCRKPLPGLFLKAAEEFQIDLKISYCVGDKLTDILAGRAVGCQNILVLTGEGSKQNTGESNDFVIVKDLQNAVELILYETNSYK